MDNNTRIAKNAILLYGRMALLLVLGLYTSRLILQTLGQEDFGTYTVVCGIVVLFQFLNSALTAGVQRYLNFYLGEHNNDALKKIFSQSFMAFVILTIVIVILSETVGLLVLEGYMNIPAARMSAARVVYQFSIVSTIFMMLRIPFNATVIAYERMDFYALASIIETVLKFLIVVVLKYLTWDRMIIYGILVAAVSAVMFFIHLFYCKKSFDIVNFKRYDDKHLLRGMLVFSGWNILGSAASILSNQGINLVINHFFGVLVNAGMGIANQVNNAVYMFLTSFQTAFNPQIVKSYAQNDKEYLDSFVIKTSKYSFFLMFFIILPLLVNIDFVLRVWLGDVPEFSNVFVFHLCIFTLIDSLSGPLWMLVEAEGNIKQYQIVGGISGLMVVPVTYICFLFHLPAYSGLIVHNIQLILFMLWRLSYLDKRVQFPAMRYCREVYPRILLIVVAGWFPTMLVKNAISNEVLSFLASGFTSCVVLAVLYYVVGIDQNERKQAIGFIKNAFVKKK